MVGTRYITRANGIKKNDHNLVFFTGGHHPVSLPGDDFFLCVWDVLSYNEALKLGDDWISSFKMVIQTFHISCIMKNTYK